MSVDFYACWNCNQAAYDCWRCPEGCAAALCNDCEAEHIDDDQCPFCNFQMATDWQLLQFALEKLGVTQEVLLEEYLTANM